MAECVRVNPYWVNTNLNDTHPLAKGGVGTNEEPYIVEAASQTFVVNDLLYIDSNGRFALCTLTGVQLTSAIAAIAVQAGANNASAGAAQTYVHAIRSDDVFAMNVIHATKVSAVTNQNLLGTVRGVRRDAITQFGTSITTWGVDIENSVEGAADANARVKIIGFVQRGLVFEADGTIGTNKKINLPDPVAATAGDTYGLVLVHFLPLSLASDGNPNQRILQLSN